MKQPYYPGGGTQQGGHPMLSLEQAVEYPLSLYGGARPKG
jgi:hypothetical protein